MSFAFIDAEKAASRYAHVPSSRRQPERVLCVEGPTGQSAPARGHGLPVAHSHSLPAVERHLRQPTHASRSGRGRPQDRPHRTARLMRENKLVARQKRRFKRTTDSEHAWPVAPNLVAQDFGGRPGQEWGADISYIWTAEGWLYLAVDASTCHLAARRWMGHE
jgi:transposase InsO family protein